MSIKRGIIKNNIPLWWLNKYDEYSSFSSC